MKNWYKKAQNPGEYYPFQQNNIERPVNDYQRTDGKDVMGVYEKGGQIIITLNGKDYDTDEEWHTINDAIAAYPEASIQYDG